jgi:hypothetical protein
MDKGESMSYNEGIGYISSPPFYSVECECGLTIGGTAEKGVYTLLKKHKEKGIFHDEWLDGTSVINNQTS